MIKFGHIICTAVFLMGLLDISMSLKCSSCSRAHSESDCHHETNCEAGKVCYITKETRWITDRYESGCGLKETHCGDLSSQNSPDHHSGFLGLLSGRREETKCCDTGDMCNIHLSFSTNEHVTSTPPPFQLSSGIECEVCSGSNCGVNREEMMRCPDEFPYCMNVVLNESSGSKVVTKRCAKRSECQRNNNSACVNFDPSEIYAKSLECIYCCETNGCNKDIVPRAETMTMG